MNNDVRAVRRTSVSRARQGGERGYVTAEAAMVLPVLLTVLALAVWILVCVSAQLRCVDAARAAARVAARGDSVQAAVAAGRSVGPAGAQVTVGGSGDRVEVQVSAQVRPFGAVLRLLPALRVTARAVAEREGATVSAP